MSSIVTPELVTARANTPIDEDAERKAVDVLTETYHRAYVEGARHAFDNDDRREAHHEAMVEAFEAALITYLAERRPTLILPGVTHVKVSAWTDSWETYDALTVDDGWRLHERDGTEWKTGVLNGREMTVFRPFGERPEAQS